MTFEAGGLPLIIFGLVISGIGIYALSRNYRLYQHGVFAIGTITRIRYKRRGVPTLDVKFITTRKKIVEFNAGGGTFIRVSTPLYAVGNQVMVLYDPNNPRQAVIYSWEFLYLIPIATICMGIFMIYQGWKIL